MSLKKVLVLFIALVCISVRSHANAHVYTNAEFLYANARIDDLEYALHVKTSFAPATLKLKGSAEKQNVHFKWDPGARVGIGCQFDHHWNIDLIGTYIHSKAAGSAKTSTTASNDLLHTLWFQSFTGFRAGSAHADWTLDFATIDLVGTRTFRPLKHFTLAPFFGLRSVLIHQRYEIDYKNVLFSLMTGGTMLPFSGANINMHSRYLAGGLTGGTDLIVPLMINSHNHLSLKGGIGGSLVFGHSRVNERIKGAFPIPGDILIHTDLDLPSHGNHVRANLESEVDVSYTHKWKHCAVEFAAGYFYSIWFDQNDFFNLVFTATNIVDVELQDNLSTIAKKHANLQLQGLILSTTVYF